MMAMIIALLQILMTGDNDYDNNPGGSMRLVGGNLLVENVQVDDSGDYRCVAENYIGHQGTSVRLSVTGNNYIILYYIIL